MVIFCFTSTNCARLNTHELPRTDIQGLGFPLILMAGIKLFKRLRGLPWPKIFSLFLSLDDARPSVGPFYKLTHLLLFSKNNSRISKKPMISQILSDCGAGGEWPRCASSTEPTRGSPGLTCQPTNLGAAHVPEHLCAFSELLSQGRDTAPFNS